MFWKALETNSQSIINTYLENENRISDNAWTNMACEPEDAELFLEYGTRLKNGTFVDTSKRRGKLLPSFDYKEFDLKTYLNNWVPYYSNSKNMEDYYEFGNLKIGGGGFISGIIPGKNEIYLRTDVGGAYKYDYTINSLTENLGENKESTIKVLKEFLKFSKIGKIVLNQNNDFFKIVELSKEKIGKMIPKN